MHSENWNHMILTNMKRDMMDTAYKLTNDLQLLYDLSEVIDAIGIGFIMAHDKSLLKPACVREYSRLTFIDIAEKIPQQLDESWRELGIFAKFKLYFSFKDGARRMQSISILSRKALERY